MIPFRSNYLFFQLIFQLTSVLPDTIQEHSRKIGHTINTIMLNYFYFTHQFYFISLSYYYLDYSLKIKICFTFKTVPILLAYIDAAVP
jgi:hypothetical protein